MPAREVSKFIWWTVRLLLRRFWRFLKFRVLHVEDTPHRIALGVAIAIFVTWTPTIGLQMVLAVAIAALMNANKLVGLPFVWISNPLTLIPIYAPNYLVGNWLLGGRYGFSTFIESMGSATRVGGSLASKVLAFWKAVTPIFLPLWVGSLVVASTLAVGTYFLTYWGIATYRKHHPPARPAPAQPVDAALKDAPAASDESIGRGSRCESADAGGDRSVRPDGDKAGQ
jgi:hypothetical protein